MGGSSKKTETTNQTRDPWAPAQSGLKDILAKAQTLGGNMDIWTPTYSNATTGAVNALGQLGQQPSFGAETIRNAVGGATTGAGIGQNQLQQTASGNYLNSNPYLDAALGYAGQNTADMVNSQFSGAGRYGSGAHTGALTRELGGLYSNAMMSNYNTERQNQLGAAGTLNQSGLAAAQMAPTVDAAQAQQIGYGLQAGQMQDQMAQAQRMAPINGLNWQTGVTAPIAGLGGTSNGTTTSSTTPSMGQQIMGGVGMGLGLLTTPMTGGASLMGTAAAPTMLGKMGGYF